MERRDVQASLSIRLPGHVHSGNLVRKRRAVVGLDTFCRRLDAQLLHQRGARLRDGSRPGNDRERIARAEIHRGSQPGQHGCFQRDCGSRTSISAYFMSMRPWQWKPTMPPSTTETTLDILTGRITTIVYGLASGINCSRQVTVAIPRWGDRFGTISAAFNFYSSTEDVLNNADGNVPSIGTERAWVCQEMRKGTTLMWLAPGNCEAGWGFNGDYGGLTVEQANALSNFVLQTNSFFLHFDDEDLYGTNGSARAQQPGTHRQLLADAIPALSNPSGRNSLGSVAGNGNQDLDGLRRGDYPSGWPDDDNRWHHSDIKNIAFPYNYRAFDQIVNDGGLK